MGGEVDVGRGGMGERGGVGCKRAGLGTLSVRRCVQGRGRELRQEVPKGAASTPV